MIEPLPEAVAFNGGGKRSQMETRGYAGILWNQLFIEGNLNQQETLETKETTEIIMLGYRELLETKDHRKKGKRNRWRDKRLQRGIGYKHTRGKVTITSHTAEIYWGKYNYKATKIKWGNK